MSQAPKKKLLTGIQASGTLHIGNYFGALKPFADIYEGYDSMIMVADYHAITSLRDGAQLRQNTIDVVKDYLACGIDPNKAIIFKQSDVPEHTELAWVLSSVMPVKYLELAHAYKDKVAKGIDANVGLFTYPILMAADILLYDTEVVPVGEDQRQHVEYAREAAKKFNVAYFGKDIIEELKKRGGVSEYPYDSGDEFYKLTDQIGIDAAWNRTLLAENPATLVQPQEMILEGTGIVPGTDGKKMSKSYKNTIPLFGTKDEITKAVKTIVTDSSGDFPEHVYAIHRLLKTEEELAPLYEENRGKYGNLKNALIEDLEAFIKPMREKRDAITDERVKEVLEQGNKDARDCASKKMKLVRDLIGINI